MDDKEALREDIYDGNGKLFRLAKRPGTDIYFADPGDCNSTHGGSGYSIGSFWIDENHIICGICGVVTEAPAIYKSYPPPYISGNPPLNPSLNPSPQNKLSEWIKTLKEYWPVLAIQIAAAIILMYLVSQR